MTASRPEAMAFSFFRLAGVFRNRKSTSTVVTGAPCNAAAALPIRTASKPWRSSSCAMRASMGEASMVKAFLPTVSRWWDGRWDGRQHAFGHGELERVDALAGDARDLEAGEAALDRQFAQPRHALGILRDVHLGGHQDHGLPHQVVAETGQLLHDGFEILHGVAAARVREVHQVRQQACALDVAQDLDAQAVAQMGAFYEAGDVAHPEAAGVVHTP